MDEHFLWQEEHLWKCRKHPSRRHPYGVCPSCLRDRLLLLCPDCGNMRPCACYPFSSSSSSSSFSSISSVDPARSSVSGAIGAVGRVSSLLEVEPPFRRSRSLALSFRRPRSSDIDPPPKPKMMWGQLWPFSSFKAKVKIEEEVATADFTNLSRSRSVGAANYSDEKNERAKARMWHFPSPMRAFRHLKPMRVVHERSPMCRNRGRTDVDF